MVKETT